jgi:hypothetical protein
MDSDGVSIINLSGVHNESQYVQRMQNPYYTSNVSNPHSSGGLDVIGTLGKGIYNLKTSINSIISNTSGVAIIKEVNVVDSDGTYPLHLVAYDGSVIRHNYSTSGYNYIEVYPTYSRENIIIVEKFYKSSNDSSGYAIILNATSDTPVGLKVLIIIG